MILTRNNRALWLTLALLALLACSAATESRAKAPVVDATRITVAGLPNLARITPGIYRGGQPDDGGYAWLKSRGFKTVISFRSWHDESRKVKAAGMRSVLIPIQADLFGSTPPTDSQVREFFRIVLNPANQPVYFHCAHGMDRTGTMAALYRMEVDGWTNEEAHREMDRFGFHHIYKDLHKFVLGYKPRGTFVPIR